MKEEPARKVAGSAKPAAWRYSACNFTGSRKTARFLVKSAPMQTVRIHEPLRCIKSWSYLAGAVSLWIAALLFEPSDTGVTLGRIWVPPCPLKALTGLPCPFCGLTTGIAWLVRWQWRKAWFSNMLSPLILLIAVTLGIYAVGYRILAGRSIDWELSSAVRRRLWLTGGLIVALS